MVDPSERNILNITAFGHFLSHFNMLVFPALVLPLSGRLGLSLGDTLALSFWMYLLFGITALPWGIAADRWGARPLLVLFFVGCTGCGVAAAFLIDSPVGLTLSLAGIGLFTGIYHPAGLGLVARGVKRISRGMAYNGIAGNLGLAAGPLLTGLMNWLWGPRAAYLTLAALNLLGVVVMLAMTLEEPPREQGSQARAAGGLVVPFLVLLLAMMLGGFTYRGATVTIPAYFELQIPMIMTWLGNLWPGELSGNLVATALTAFIMIVGAIGQYTGGAFGERYDPRWGYLAFHLISLPAVVAMAFVSDLALVVATLIYIFFLLGMQPMENTLVARLSPPALRHSAYGAKFVLTFGVGSVSVWAVGFMQNRWDMGSVFLLLSCFTAALVLAIALLITRTTRAQVS